jgi:hypothetical protein
MKNSRIDVYKIAIVISIAWAGYSFHRMAESLQDSENISRFQQTDDGFIIDTKTGSLYENGTFYYGKSGRLAKINKASEAIIEDD